jgi:integrative and conjugative element protein (TIGR02256 family)
MMAYPIAASGQRLVFTRAVLDHFNQYRQNGLWEKEAGGQLFARLQLPKIIVEEATGPRVCDRRARFAYRPNRVAEQREITTRYARGLHFVGDWHTHPEPVPKPSSCDIENINEMFSKSAHEMNGFLLVIIGTNPPPSGLFVSVTDGSDVFQLLPKIGD